MSVIEFEVSAAEPFLDHHRPGGLPLLGTAMGIELMARVVRQVHGKALESPISLTDIAILEPLILSGDSATVSVRVDSQTTMSFGAVRCFVEGWQPHAAAVKMFEAQVLPARPWVAHRIPRTELLSGDRALCIPGGAVYELFFHGPAFQVVGEARYADGAMCCALASDLPPLSQALTMPYLAAPRWVELCMQCAGLLQVAENARMMIPHRIERLVIHPLQSLSSQLFAVARETGGGTMDVTLSDADGVVCLQMTGYHTVPLPFPAPAAAVDALHRRFATTA